MNLLFKTYTWSVVLEPLLFFVVAYFTVTGVGANVSRILQMAVVGCLLLKFISSSVPLAKVHPLNRLYINYTIYLALACISGIYGLAIGAYAVPDDYNVRAEGLAAFLNTEWTRPLFEYVVAVYYFAYFVILPQLFLKNERRIAYFFKVFFFTFNLSLVIGYIDLVFAFFGSDLVGRHLADNRNVGFRFHGLAGEPRDAFGYLLFGLAMSYLRWHQTGIRMNRWWLAALALALVLTQTASGLLGILIFVLLLVTLGVGRLNKYVLAVALVLIIALPPAIYLAIENSVRLSVYRDALLLVWDALEKRGEIPLQLRGQMTNIYPMYDLIVKARDFDLMPLIIGSGLGSASALNNTMRDYGQLANPNSQLIRVIYEGGLIGFVFLFLAFYKPMILMTARFELRSRRAFAVLTLLLIAAFLAHRNVGLFIFLGLAIATFRMSRQTRDVPLRVEPAAVRGSPAIAPSSAR